jgi:acetyltransferase-like isoleucine patch superfamily enzyme
VSVGDCCYLGSQCIVAAGAQIGDHCVIGANSYVNANIEPFSVAAGTPARRIGQVTLESDRVVLRYDSGRVVALQPDGNREPNV